MTILVTGANGQLGNEMRVLASSSSDSFVFTDVSDAAGTEYLDITDSDAVGRMVREKSIDVIVNCAAYTNVDAAEDNVELAELLNAAAPGILANAAKEAGALLVHISSDYVFGGEPYNTPCTEDLPCTPTGVYGFSKLHGEQAVQASGCEYVILRSAWLYSEFGKNFVKTMLRLTSEKPRLDVVFDQVGTPTYALDLAEVIGTVIEDWRNTRGNYAHGGIYNYTNEGVCSWYDFAKRIAAIAGNFSCEVLPCHSSEFPSKVKRPSFSVLDKTKIKKTFGIGIPYWMDSLEKCMSRL